MNYIIHLNKTFGKFCEDDRLTPYHISLYFGLFQYWNLAKFRNPISISRDEMMRASKIGSVNTYIRCLKELDVWQYIQYKPSYNPQKGSQVYLYNFDNANDKTKNNATDISNDKASDKAAKKTTGKASETPVIPSINNLNKTNKLNNKNKYEHTRKKSSKKSLSLHSRKTSAGRRTKEKSSGQKEKVSLSFGEGRKGEAPTLNEIKIFFIEKKWPLLEAEKFFNYYESNGWLIAGKSPMKNWKASSANWMLNSEKYSRPVTSSGVEKKLKPGKLHTTNNKNYAEPL